jgi:hypothetical protein
MYLQFYATIFWDACEKCLQNHGKIFEEGNIAHPPLHDGCRCSVLSFPASELKYYREHGKRMEERSNVELERRELLQMGRQTLAQAPEKAYEFFQKVAEIELYPEEVQQLFRTHGQSLKDNFDLSKKLLKLFLRANRYRYDLRKYENMPPRMQEGRIAHGEGIIRSLFHEWLPNLDQEHL